MTDSLHYLSARVSREADDLHRWMATLEQRATFHLAHLDGFPSATMSDGLPRGTAELTGVEAAAAARLTITAGHGPEVHGGIDQLHDDFLAVLDQLASMRVIRDRLLRALPSTDRQPVTVVVNCSGDPLCTNHVHARGMCATHYSQARRLAIASGEEWADATLTERPDDSATRMAS